MAFESRGPYGVRAACGRFCISRGARRNSRSLTGERQSIVAASCPRSIRCPAVEPSLCVAPVRYFHVRYDFRSSQHPLAVAGLSTSNAPVLLVVLAQAAMADDTVHSGAVVACFDRRNFSKAHANPNDVVIAGGDLPAPG